MIIIYLTLTFGIIYIYRIIEDEKRKKKKKTKDNIKYLKPKF